MSSEKLSVAVIGGGLTAASLLSSLLDRLDRQDDDVCISIYEPNPKNLASGPAFGDDWDCAIVNLPNSRMTVRNEDPLHFARWLGRRGKTVGEVGADETDHGFAPRRVFGEYLKEHFDECVRVATGQRGWKVAVHSELVTSIARGGGTRNLSVISEQAAREHTHAVVAIGAGTPLDPYDLSAAPGFIPDPYPLREKLSSVQDSRDVLVIGSGLTAVDVALGLLHQGHRGRITLASRRGVLPEVISDLPHPLELRHLTREAIIDQAKRTQGLTLRHVWQLLRRELSSIGTAPDETLAWFQPPRDSAAYLRHQLARPATPVQAIFDAAGSEINPLIRCLLPARERVHLATTYRTYLKSLQCPMPRRTGSALLNVMEAGQLRVRAGLVGVRSEGDGFRVEFEGSLDRAQVVVDATRGTPGTGGPGARLVESLKRSGFAVSDAYGGLRTHPRSGLLVSQSAEGGGNLFAVGELTAGAIYYASSLPAVNRGSTAIADSLATERVR